MFNYIIQSNEITDDLNHRKPYKPNNKLGLRYY